jgi:O-antigen/teichoic acid export membrane protein
MQPTKKLVFSNALFSSIQVTISGILLFILYKFLFKILGSEIFGLWALILGITSFSQVADFGFSASLTKFVAKYDALDDKAKISSLIQTVIISTAAISTVVLVAIYPLAKFILSKTVSISLIEITNKLIPLSLISFWFAIISNTIQTSMDGLQLIKLKNLIIILYSFLNCAFLLTASIKFGIIGLAYSQIILNLIILILNWVFLRRNLKLLPKLPFVWEKKSFKEIISYSVTFQASSIFRIFFEPIVKIFIAKYNGLSFVSYFEFGSKLVVKLRQILVSANSVLVPVFANLKEKKPEKILNIYKKSYSLIFLSSTLLFSSIILFSPLISKIWIGDYNKTFVLYLIFLSVAWFISTMNAPAYFLNLGTGEVIWNLLSDIIIMAINVLLVFLIGKSINNYGVILSWSIALSLGSLIITAHLILKKFIKIQDLFEKKNTLLLLSTVIYIAIFMVFYFLPFFYNSDIKYRLLIIYIFPIIYVISFCLFILKVSKNDLKDYKNLFIYKREDKIN